MKELAILFSILFCMVVAGGVQAAMVNFDGLTPTILYSGGGYYENGQNLSGSYVSGGATFTNNYSSSWGSWDGWAYSNTSDTTKECRMTKCTFGFTGLI